MAKAVPATVTRPVVARTTLRASGQRAHSLRVYCDRREGSVSIDECVGCPSCISLDTQPDGEGQLLTCVLPEDHHPPPLGRVGSLVCQGVFVVEPDTPIGHVAALFAEHGLAIAGVADPTGRLIGMVHESHLVSLRRAYQGRVGESGVDAWRLAALRPVTELASLPRTVLETASVRQAVETMAASRNRVLFVVDADGLPVGILGDVEAMLALARAAREAT